MPVAIAAIVLVIAGVAHVVAPPSLGRAVPLAAAAAFVIAYAIWPKPTLLAFALVVLFARTLERWFAPELPFLDNFAMPALLVLAAWRTKPWRRSFFRPVRDLALVALLGAGIASALVANVPWGIWVAGTLVIAKLIAFLYIVEWHDFSADDLRQFIPFVLGAAFVVLGVAVIEALDPARVRVVLNLGPLANQRAGLPSVVSLLTHPGIFAWFCTFVALFLYAGFVVYRRWWMMLVGAAFAFATMLSARRRAVLSLATGLIAGAAAHARRRAGIRRSLTAWLPVLIATVVTVVAFGPALARIFDQTIDELTDPTTPRVALYSASVEIAIDHLPLGVGFGRFGSTPSKDPYSPVYAEYGLDQIPGLTAKDPSFIQDAFWARILGESGVIGLVALLVFLGAVAVSVWRSARLRYGEALVTAFTLGAWMFFVQGVTDSLTSVGLDSPPRMYLFFGAVGVALSLGRNLGHADDVEPADDVGPADDPTPD